MDQGPPTVTELPTSITITLREAGRRLSEELGRDISHHAISALVKARGIATYRSHLNRKAQLLDGAGYRELRRLLTADEVVA